MNDVATVVHEQPVSRINQQSTIQSGLGMYDLNKYLMHHAPCLLGRVFELLEPSHQRSSKMLIVVGICLRKAGMVPEERDMFYFRLGFGLGVAAGTGWGLSGASAATLPEA